MLKETGEPCHMSIKILLQHMCMRVPDKAEYRSKAAQVLIDFGPHHHVSNGGKMFDSLDLTITFLMGGGGECLTLWTSPSCF